MKNPPNAGLFRLMVPPRESDHPPTQNRDTPPRRLRSSTFHSFETPQEPNMLRAQNDLRVYLDARYNRFQPRRHVQKLFIFEIEFHFTFLGQKAQKVELKVIFSFSKNSITLNDLVAGFLSINLRSFFCVSNF